MDSGHRPEWMIPKTPNKIFLLLARHSHTPYGSLLDSHSVVHEGEKNRTVLVPLDETEHIRAAKTATGNSSPKGNRAKMEHGPKKEDSWFHLHHIEHLIAMAGQWVRNDLFSREHADRIMATPSVVETRTFVFVEIHAYAALNTCVRHRLWSFIRRWAELDRKPRSRGPSEGTAGLRLARGRPSGTADSGTRDVDNQAIADLRHWE